MDIFPMSIFFIEYSDIPKALEPVLNIGNSK